MAISEICKDGIRIRLVREDDRLFLQIDATDNPEESREGLLPADPDVLCSVLRGLTYQLASQDGYCLIRRVGENVHFEFQAGSIKSACQLTAEEFSKIIGPVVPMRLRAMLL